MRHGRVKNGLSVKYIGERKGRGRPRNDVDYVKDIFYNGGLADRSLIERVFNVGRERAYQIRKRLLYEGVMLGNRGPLFLFDRYGLSGFKIRMVTTVTLVEILLAIRFILLAALIVLGPLMKSAIDSFIITMFVTPPIVIASTFLFLYPDKLIRKGKFELKRVLAYGGLILLALHGGSPERLGVSLFASISVIVVGALIWALYVYTKYLCGLDKKISLHVTFEYKNKTFYDTLKVKENITVNQLIEFILKTFLKRDLVNAENYVATLSQNNEQRELEERSRKIFKCGIRDRDKINVISRERQKDRT